MKGERFHRICLAAAVTVVILAQFGVPDGRAVEAGSARPYVRYVPSGSQDTVIYDIYGYRRGWTEEDFRELSKVDVRMSGDSTGGFSDDGDLSALLRPAALDTLIAPDSLLLTDTFRYYFYAALKDSLCHVYVRDSLKSAGDTLLWPRLDSLYAADSTAAAKLAFDIWYAGLSRKERRAYDFKMAMPARQARLDSIADAKDSLKAVRDSIISNTPRILETSFVPDSLMYKRFFTWTHEQEFHNLHFNGYADTTYNYRYYSYPFNREDVDATWLGVSGSPALYHDFTKRVSKEGVSFYDAQECWTLSPSTLPFYNTKTPYTELAYFGTAFTSGDKATDNIHILTTQNITPEANFLLLYDRYGGGGMLDRETTINKTAVVAGNYIGKRYLMHAGFIYNLVSRQENGGLADVSMIRDTTLDARDIPVILNDAQSKIKRKTLFLDQQYRIPFYFLMSEEQAASDTLGTDTDVTTAFIGHSTEFSIFSRDYSDKITSSSGRNFYNGVFNYNPSASYDSMSVRKFDNKVFIRLQPWSDEAIVSKLDAGIGEKIMSYYTFDPSLLMKNSRRRWTSTYLYAGAEGQLKQYIGWDASGRYSFAGDEAGDFDLEANAKFNVFPFRRHRSSPLSITGHFETSLREPEYYQQHLYTNHFAWDNSFGKISTTKVQGTVSVPRWNMDASAGYSLLSGNIYYDNAGTVRQNGSAMSILTASLHKDFVIGGFLHLDNRVLFQLSSDQAVVPLPMVALNARYYVQFPVTKGVLDLQIGVNTLYTTLWHAPAWNPALGVFHNQDVREYGNCPYFDAFVNAQWKRACIFARLENAGMGWPMDKYDYFCADGFIRTQRAFKLGIYWPFYTQPQRTGILSPHSHSSSPSASGTDSGRSLSRH